MTGTFIAGQREGQGRLKHAGRVFLMSGNGAGRRKSTASASPPIPTGDVYEGSLRQWPPPRRGATMRYSSGGSCARRLGKTGCLHPVGSPMPPETRRRPPTRPEVAPGGSPPSKPPPSSSGPKIPPGVRGWPGCGGDGSGPRGPEPMHGLPRPPKQAGAPMSQSLRGDQNPCFPASAALAARNSPTSDAFPCPTTSSACGRHFIRVGKSQ